MAYSNMTKWRNTMTKSAIDLFAGSIRETLNL